jgi:hypothetical protein
LIAVLVEIGSALGFTFILLASRSATAAPASAARMAKGPEDIALGPERRPAKPGMPMKLSETPADTISRWAFSRLDVLRAGRIQAEVAYGDFVGWCDTGGIEACSRQMFGRRFAEVVKGMGGRKVKINGRAYYEGVVLQRRSAQIQRDLAMAA